MSESHDVIRKLHPRVIAKIAAGEVVVRPAAAIKEIIENSIDAGARTIKLRIAANPLDFAEVADDGCGVSPTDLLVICRRFTTSKTQDDITGVKSFGFRGEALAALSHSANVVISSRTAREEKRTVMRYSEGEPLTETANEVTGPVGFTISYENLFFNMNTRGKTLSASPSTEFTLCLELMQKYAVHFPHIEFVFHKVGSSTHDLNTHREDGEAEDFDFRHFNEVHAFPPDAVDTPELVHYREHVQERSAAHLERVLRAIKNVYGATVTNTLYQFQTHSTGDVYYNCKGFFTHPNQPNRCHSFILFINNRLVEHPILRRNIDSVYKELLHKKQRRFVYLSVYMPYERIDANVHPSKEKIFFQHQDEIIEEIGNKLREHIRSILKVNMENAQSSSAFSQMEISTRQQDIEEPIVPHLKKTYEVQEKAKLSARHKVRSDYRQLDIPSFVIPSYILESHADLDSYAQKYPKSHEVKPAEAESDDIDSASSTSNAPVEEDGLQHLVAPKLGNLDFSLMDITGQTDGFSDMWNIQFVKEFINEFESTRDQSLTDTILNSVLVGVADKRYVILQHDTALYMVDIIRIAKECTFQSIIWRIGQLPKLVLNPPLCLVDLISYALAREDFQKNGSAGKIDKSQFRSKALEMVKRFHVGFLTKYFGFKIESNALHSIPKIISNYFPGTEYLPGLILAIFSLEIVDEARAVGDIAHIISEFYTFPPFHSITTADPIINERNYEHYLSKVLLRADGSHLKLAVVVDGDVGRSLQVALGLLGQLRVDPELGLLRALAHEDQLRLVQKTAGQPQEGPLEVEVGARRQVVVLEVALAVELDVAGLHLALLHVGLVATEHHGDVVAHADDVAVPVGDVAVGDAAGHVEHDDGALALDVVAVTEPAVLLLARRVPRVELDATAVGAELQRVNLDTEGRDVLLFELPGKMALDQGGFANTTVAHKEQFELGHLLSHCCKTMSMRLIVCTKHM
ncbi:DNA mismatch repair protein MLH, putative [Babesia caballi]|uniref:DNA mismatch repair protein MLH, putative n=1 Tax=Babesia caballi TaxID=5871 RepID=A0AAV4LQY1_BABCB|nr:DNA mismatch repair protein MLH, putative [Babesia caballi]